MSKKSAAKPAGMPGSSTKRDVLSTLKAAELVAPKAALPAGKHLWVYLGMVREADG